MRYLIRDIRRLIHGIRQLYHFRRCKGDCASTSPHSHHLTRAGLRYYTRET